MAKARPSSTTAARADAEPALDPVAIGEGEGWDDKAGPSKQVASTEAADGIVYETPAESPPHKPVQWLLKRLFDVGFAATCLLLGLPFLLFIAVAVKLDSDGPVLYRQIRVGRNGKLFEILKFRSMHTDAERHGPRWARSQDTRVTRVGGLLRRTSLDELPQIWNVLTGEMSLIGPRPERPVFVSRFRRQINGYDLRHSVRPGLSGWAQVNGLRGNVSIETRTDYDVHYVRHFSLWLDVVCFFRTFSAVLAGE
jgi:exopolysaccharide biosynthesis polyprenyl glycosylphosphotransferase